MLRKLSDHLTLSDSAKSTLSNIFYIIKELTSMKRTVVEYTKETSRGKYFPSPHGIEVSKLMVMHLSDAL